MSSTRSRQKAGKVVGEILRGRRAGSAARSAAGSGAGRRVGDCRVEDAAHLALDLVRVVELGTLDVGGGHGQGEGGRQGENLGLHGCESFPGRRVE